MAAPSLISRTTPAGDRMDDGYQSIIAFDAFSGVRFWEKGMTPPGLDGGEAVVTTTMFNSIWRTMNSMALYTLTPVTYRAAWDVELYNAILDAINVETEITVYFPTDKHLNFYGFLQRFEPGELVEGTQPEATITVVPTNWDPVNQTEEAPVVGT